MLWCQNITEFDQVSFINYEGESSSGCVIKYAKKIKIFKIQNCVTQPKQFWQIKLDFDKLWIITLDRSKWYVTASKQGFIELKKLKKKLEN